MAIRKQNKAPAEASDKVARKVAASYGPSKRAQAGPAVAQSSTEKSVAYQHPGKCSFYTHDHPTTTSTMWVKAYHAPPTDDSYSTRQHYSK